MKNQKRVLMLLALAGLVLSLLPDLEAASRGRRRGGRAASSGSPQSYMSRSPQAEDGDLYAGGGEDEKDNAQNEAFAFVGNVEKEARRQFAISQVVIRLEQEQKDLADQAREARENAKKPAPRRSKTHTHLKSWHQSADEFCDRRCSAGCNKVCKSCSSILYNTASACRDITMECLGAIASPCKQLCSYLASPFKGKSNKEIVATGLLYAAIFTIIMEKSGLFEKGAILAWEYHVASAISENVGHHAKSIANGLWKGINNPEQVQQVAQSVYELCIKNCPGAKETATFAVCHATCSK